MGERGKPRKASSLLHRRRCRTPRVKLRRRNQCARHCRLCWSSGGHSPRQLVQDLGDWQDFHAEKEVEESQRDSGQDASDCRCPLEREFLARHPQWHDHWKVTVRNETSHGGNITVHHHHTRVTTLWNERTRCRESCRSSSVVCNASSPQSQRQSDRQFRDRESCRSAGTVLSAGSPQSRLQWDHDRSDVTIISSFTLQFLMVNTYYNIYPWVFKPLNLKEIARNASVDVQVSQLCRVWTCASPDRTGESKDIWREWQGEEATRHVCESLHSQESKACQVKVHYIKITDFTCCFLVYIEEQSVTNISCCEICGPRIVPLFSQNREDWILWWPLP